MYFTCIGMHKALHNDCSYNGHASMGIGRFMANLSIYIANVINFGTVVRFNHKSLHPVQNRPRSSCTVPDDFMNCCTS